jgi:hypothetical protein
MKTLFVLLLFIGSTVAVHAQYTEYSKVLAESVYRSDRIVKGAPFSAEAVNENIQILADGNRIIRRTTSRIYRDGEGRYRREDMPKQLGLPGAVIDMPESIFILDPVAGFRYSLNPKTNTVRKTPFRSAFEYKLKSELDYKLKSELERVKVYTAEAGVNNKIASEQDAAQTGKDVQKAERLAEKAKIDAERKKQLAVRKEELEKRIRERSTGAATVAVPYTYSSKYETKSESLGVQNVEGVQAEGTRSTTTIPAGTVGNERPIDVVYEKWYSKDLQMIILSKHNDPRIGEQTYRLTNIRRDEPSSSLFSPPADYRVIEDSRPQPRTIIVVKGPAAPKAMPVVTTVPEAPKKPDQ